MKTDEIERGLDGRYKRMDRPTKPRRNSTSSDRPLKLELHGTDTDTDTDTDIRDAPIV